MHAYRYKKNRLQSLMGRHFGGHPMTTNILRFFWRGKRGVLSDTKGKPLSMQYSKTSLYRNHRETGIMTDGITSLVIDQGLEFCQLNVDIVGHVCPIGEKQYLHCTFRQFRSGKCNIGGHRRMFQVCKMFNEYISYNNKIVNFASLIS